MSGKTVNPDLAVERRNVDFSVNELSAYIYGGHDKLQRRQFLADVVERTPALQESTPVEFMSREQRYEEAARKILACAAVVEEHSDVDNLEEVAYIEGLSLAGETHPLNLHYVMFLPTIQNQATDEQQEKWLIPTLRRALVGTYAQTEMGHGTNLRRLETTATYDPDTQEFVIHTPTLSATKWWPGNLGKTANYAVVMAQLWTQGKSQGPHPFIVQLRDSETHLPLPGVIVGDIGPKFGIQSNDNGFLLLDRVRIPRDHMLMRHAQVTKEGRYIPPSHAKLSYGSMIFVRMVMMRRVALNSAIAATIATRYSTIRRQGELTPGGEEVKLLDYQTQQHRVLPSIGLSLAIYVAATHIRDVYEVERKKILTGNTDGLAQLHALSSGLKAHGTWEVAKAIEQCRLACGGHGYLKASGLPELYATHVGGCTYEGDNIVLFLQTARFLMKEMKAARSGQTLTGTTAYLSQRSRSNSPLDHNLEPRHIIDILEHISRRLNSEGLVELESRISKGERPELARNALSVRLSSAARAHVLVFLAASFAEWAEAGPETGGVKRVLGHVLRMFLLGALIDKAAGALEDNYVNRRQIAWARSGYEAALAAVRTNAVGLVDAWALRDRQLRSVLGRYDGDVYPHLFHWAQHSQLNKKEVLDAHWAHMYPMMKDAQSKL